MKSRWHIAADLWPTLILGGVIGWHASSLLVGAIEVIVVVLVCEIGEHLLRRAA